MSQSQFAGGERFEHRSDDRPTSITDEDEIDDVLEALEDDDCRTILAATTDNALSVTEISEQFDIALSTAYRKVDALVEAGLLEETLRLRHSGNHVNTYACSVDDVTMSIDAETGVTLSIDWPETEAAFPHTTRR